MNRIGHSGRSIYDEQAYDDKILQTTSPMQYQLNPERVYNENYCASNNGAGPRSGYYGNGISLPVTNRPAVAQASEVTDIESILTNRNMRLSKLSSEGANKIDVTKMKLKNMDACGNYLNSVSSRLSFPAANYRDAGINRFYDPIHIANQPLFWDFAANTRLEATDNYHGVNSETWAVDPSLPNPNASPPFNCMSMKYCPGNIN